MIGPIRVDNPQSENGWTVARVFDVEYGGAAEFSEFQELIEERLRNQGLTERVVEGLRSQAYIEVRLGGG